MKKKFIIKLLLPVGLLAVGIVLLVLSLIFGVSYEVSARDISKRPHDDGYFVWAKATGNTRGIFELQQATVKWKVVDADNNELYYHIIVTKDTVIEFRDSYVYTDGIPPENIVAEVLDAKFNNSTFIILSSLLIIISSVMTSVLVYEKVKNKENL